ncbi:restriction endonuclease subunit S [Mycoplasmopsis caviae]|uniref:Restriction modification enzyme subunit S2B n=1 Tax=Mycoplasmopsis caviae TaxID=55603 RepID=A0A3P8LAH5_9BACT|nr:restriction endonuclease subunit S [Mycoplasmopsis caviae]VDR41741.1 restriction modification enzyme subunit S2B [Mycoplasmopsis caviae]
MRELKYYKIGEICDISRGKTYTKQYIANHSGKYPLYSSQTINNGVLGYISSYDFDGEYVTWTTDGVYAGTIFYRDKKFSLTTHCGLLSIKDKNIISPKFLSYILSINSKKYVNYASSNPNLTSNVMAEISIPVPPLEKQKEIVDKLDKFVTLEAELKAELEARGKQYNHYRDQLLNWTTPNIFKNVIESERTVLITDLFNYERGKRLIKANRIKGDIPFVTAGHLNDGISEYISNEEKIFENCITIDMFGNIFWRPYKFMCDDNIICLGSDFLNESNALYFVEKIKMTINKFDYSKQYRIKHLENHRISVSFIRNELDHKAINNVSLLLNTIWKYTNNLYAGLPNEIELRAKQYEYYRNLLLAPANLRERERESTY